MEKGEGPASGSAAAEATNASAADPVAVALALNSANVDPSIAEDARAFLRKQTAFLDNHSALIAAQLHHLHEEIKHLHLDMWEKRLGVWLRAATFCVGIAFAGAIGAMVWEAHESNNLLIQPFSVPPDLTGRGLTGQVVAKRVLDNLIKMQAQTSSQRAPASYANSWSASDFKVEIPETGVSLAELDAFLRERLGHDTRLSGELIHVPGELSISARTEVEVVQSVSGAEADIDGLLQQLAEAIYRITQPYRYGIYLSRHNRLPESEELFREMALNGPLSERPWSYNGWQNAVGERTNEGGPRPLILRSVELAPDFVLGWENLAFNDDVHSRPAVAIEDEKKVLSLLSGRGGNMIRADAVPFVREMMQAMIDRQTGDFQNALRLTSHVVEFQAGRLGGTAPNSGEVALSQTGMHAVTAARATLDGRVQGGTAPFIVTRQILNARLSIAEETEDWRGIVALASQLPPGISAAKAIIQTIVLPRLVLAEAKLGRLSAAQAHIGTSSADCYDCLIARGRVAELQGQSARADFWFARAATEAPSVPFAYFRWGEALLARGQSDAAIEKFTLSNQKGPHFADPLEGWGEALMAKNQSHLALAKFAEAEKYAPNWGRLHLKWGEALAYAGKKDEAKAQFARATQLDLTAADKAELARVNSHG